MYWVERSQDESGNVKVQAGIEDRKKRGKGEKEKQFFFYRV